MGTPPTSVRKAAYRGPGSVHVGKGRQAMATGPCALGSWTGIKNNPGNLVPSTAALPEHTEVSVFV